VTSAAALAHDRPGGCADAVEAVAGLAARTGSSVLFTFAPRTPLLAAMHAAGSLFPKHDRAPAIAPVAERRLRHLLGAAPGLAWWQAGRTQRVGSGFYTSQALELVRR
jgi:magnesium-protoporphyrin O-methyltransferase